MNTCTKFRQVGFSLIELLVGVAILALLASIALPSFQTMMVNTKVRNAAESVQNGIQRAKAEAISRNTSVAFALGADTSWTVYLSPAASGVALIDSRSGNEGSKNVTRTSLSSTLTAATIVTFDNLGGVRAPNADGSAPLAQIDFAATGSNKNMRVTVGRYNAVSNTYSGSNIRICDPNAASSSPTKC